MAIPIADDNCIARRFGNSGSVKITRSHQPATVRITLLSRSNIFHYVFKLQQLKNYGINDMDTCGYISSLRQIFILISHAR